MLDSNMSDTPQADRSSGENREGGLTATHAYSPAPDSVEHILSTSIQRAKQKITMLEGRGKEQRSRSREAPREGANSTAREGTGSNAIASAMRVLQHRVAELEKVVEGHQRQKRILLQELENASAEKKVLLGNLEEAAARSTGLQQANRNLKNDMRELGHKLDDLMAEKAEAEGRCKELELKVKHLQNDKHKMSQNLSQLEQSKRADNSSAGKDVVSDKQKALREREHRLTVLESGLKERQSRLQADKAALQHLRDQNNSLKDEVEQLKEQLQHLMGRQQEQTDNYQTYMSQISHMEEEIRGLRETTQHLSAERDHSDMETLREEVAQGQDQYEDLLRHYKRTEERVKREQKENKMHRDKIKELEDLLTQMMEKIGRLPTSTKDLKYLAVKGGKLFQSNFERMGVPRTPTKSRSNSMNRSFRSNSSKKKTEPMDLSRRSTQKEKSKSKRKEPTMRSSAKKESAKRVVVSAGGWQGLEKELGDMKKEYKRLVKALDQCENEDVRNRLNGLAFEIQQRSQKVTRLKQGQRG